MEERKSFNEIYKELSAVEVPISEIRTGYNNLLYLSWSCAFDIMARRFDDFEVIPTIFEGGKNYCLQEGVGCYVETTIIAGGHKRKWSLPVMDNKNNAILKPNMRDINDTIMRCAVKTIALFGLGIKLYMKDEANKLLQQLKEKKQDEEFFNVPPRHEETRPQQTSNNLEDNLPDTFIEESFFEKVVERYNLKNVNPQEVYNYCKKRNFIDKQGNKMTTLSVENLCKWWNTREQNK